MFKWIRPYPKTVSTAKGAGDRMKVNSIKGASAIRSVKDALVNQPNAVNKDKGSSVKMFSEKAKLEVFSNRIGIRRMQILRKLGKQ